MKLPPEINLVAAAHYLQAFDYQRYANQIVTILGSKTPHIQNLAVGGVANPINPDSQSALNFERLYYIKSLMDKVGDFIKNVYLIDVAAVAAHYPDWFGYGAGVTNYLSVPDFPEDETRYSLWYCKEDIFRMVMLVNFNQSTVLKMIFLKQMCRKV